ncbi:FecR family protein [Thauera linaloolentis]|uniref:Tat pathway signal sequence domain-containing protein 16 n=1 Tax=Thauera linaloolentis (strain DSM 12138 / JCM 21573 / CCUG 41526 / CIP 105981 / IAM 15112 / NBRC 102519 / 47Lol) TaxID=1123367 RepID=N6Z312_THAL4|nr:FecR domain-containing protein [Thauera linaloolentis]ENO88758.1 Tat pathway signal sequence domain-containing protein 16 [Thauera linaloolentis 47Lol = DSM 12138]MCM8564933.1 FecR domain-containing protein [Thauera linaloolentis]
MNARIDERLVEKALRLIARAAIDTPEATARAEAELARWQARSQENAAACHEARNRWQMLGNMAPDLREHFDAPPAGLPQPRRRQILALLLTGGATGLLGGSAWWYRQHETLLARDYRNNTRDLLLAELPDGPAGRPGSRLQLAPATHLRASLSRAARSVALTGGEAYFAIAPDAARPFRVRTRAGDIEVVGTAFSVSDRGATVDIAVEHGHVRFTPRAEGFARLPLFGPPAIDLHGGEALTLHDGHPETVRPVAPGQIAAWRDGWLVFDDMPLADALPTINAYRQQPIALADPRTGMLRLNGRFRAQDPHSLVRALPAILPLDVETLDDGSVQLTAR